MNVETIRENTLKMIRNNQRYEDLIEKLIYYARDNGNYMIASIIDECLKNIEKYNMGERSES